MSLTQLESSFSSSDSDYFSDSDESLSVSLPAVDLESVSESDFLVSQNSDDVLLRIPFQHDSRDSNFDPDFASLHRDYSVYMSFFDKISVVNDLLALPDVMDPETHRLLVPFSLVDRVFSFAHQGPDSAQLGYKRLKEKISLHYFWPSLSVHVRLFVDSCPSCDKFKPRRILRNPLNPFTVSEPNQMVALDY